MRTSNAQRPTSNFKWGKAKGKGNREDANVERPTPNVQLQMGEGEGEGEGEQGRCERRTPNPAKRDRMGEEGGERERGRCERRTLNGGRGECERPIWSGGARPRRGRRTIAPGANPGYAYGGKGNSEGVTEERSTLGSSIPGRPSPGDALVPERGARRATGIRAYARRSAGKHARTGCPGRLLVAVWRTPSPVAQYCHSSWARGARLSSSRPASARLCLPAGCCPAIRENSSIQLRVGQEWHTRPGLNSATYRVVLVAHESRLGGIPWLAVVRGYCRAPCVGEVTTWLSSGIAACFARPGRRACDGSRYLT